MGTPNYNEKTIFMARFFHPVDFMTTLYFPVNSKCLCREPPILSTPHLIALLPQNYHMPSGLTVAF